MEDILQQHETPELHKHVHAIQSDLFNMDSRQSATVSLNPSQLLKLVAGLRRTRLKSYRQYRRHQRYALPPLYKT
jgi:hypothetical protein